MPEPIPSQSNGAAYEVKIIRRPSYMDADDYHATVTRLSDGKQLVFISYWLRFLRWRVRRAALDRAFRASDRYERELAQVREFRA